ncbi:MAG: signal recognition particle-docking protein FtsY, partial [Candidatus Cloacimonadota bacterium]
TSVAKLAEHYKTRGERVLLVASDTYRAAGVEQLEIWAKRIGVDILKSRMGQDPASVAYDALESAFARGYSVVLVDTAGRLHTNKALIAELQKIKKVLSKKRNDLPQDIFLILDATTGQNSLAQARIFKNALNVTGAILTKIDGTAKGGIVIAISKELALPVRYIGTGEAMNDLIEFDPHLFVSSILETREVE